MTWPEARARFPVLDRYAYLNAGSFGPLSRASLEAMAAVRTWEGANGRAGRSYHEDRVARGERVRALLADEIGVPVDNLALTESTTRGVHVVVIGLDLGPGDEVVTTDAEHFGLSGPLAASGASLRIAKVRDAPVAELIETIRCGGLAVVKAQRIQAVLRALTEDDGCVRLQDPRQMTRADATSSLIQLPGVGRKTAACVLLFGSHVPAIPVDTHVHRVALRLGLVAPRTGPDATQDALESGLKPRDYYAFHVNMIRLGREICKAPRPRCEMCPLRAGCQSVVQSRAS